MLHKCPNTLQQTGFEFKKETNREDIAEVILHPDSDNDVSDCE
jgi:hypothetical protein